MMLPVAAANAQVVVNEFCANNDTLEVMGQTSDWIELYNSGAETVNIKGYAISDNPKKPRKYVIDTDVEIYPGCFKIVLCNGLGADLNASFKLSGDGSEYVVWSDASGNTIDEIAIPKNNRDYSYGRLIDGGSEWGTFDISTPGKTNTEQQALSPMPVFSKVAGFYTSEFKVDISCGDPNAAIYYTTNGALPTAKSTKYTGAITISNTKVLRAIAVAPGMKESHATTATYFINLRSVDLPVVCLSTDSKNFYDNRIGIYVAGTNGISGYCQDQPKNWNQPWERPVHVEVFDKNKKLQISQDAGVRITGSCSRGNDMKSLRLIARKEYGDNRFRYKFFDKKDISAFKQIVLRNAGNDFVGTMTRDALETGLVGESLDVDVQAFQPAAVFLNGEYLGLHNIREKVCTHYVEENYGADADKTDLLENKYSVIDGSNAEYKKLFEFVRDNDMADEANYQKVASQVDIDNLIDYWCAQIYIDNEDWPNNNIKYYKTAAKDSKWRWILFGCEYSLSVYGGNGYENNSVHYGLDDNTGRWSQSNWGGVFVRNLLANKKFRNQFIQRMAYVTDHTFAPTRVNQFADSLRNLMYNEWKYHSEKWYGWLNQDSWTNRINEQKNWLAKRPPYIREYMRQYFSLSGPYNVQVSSDNAGAKFSINGGMATANVSGNYYGGATLELSAKLPSGLMVDHWEVSGASCSSKSVFSYGDTWRYYDSGNAPSGNWKSDANASSGWKTGRSPLGFSPSWTPITQINGGSSDNRYSTCYFCKQINLTQNPSDILSASITIKVDDGAVVYVNGKEQGRYNMNSGNVDYGTWSSTYVADLEETVIAINPADLVKGNNLIAIEVHQTSSTSSDLWLEAKMDLVESNGSTNTQKFTDNTVSINLASDTEVKLVTKAAPTLTCENRSQTVKGSIYINEVMTRNFGVISDETNHYPAWVEFYNASDKAIDMAGLYVLDAKNQVKIPCGQPELTTIPAKGYLVFFMDGRTDLGANHLGINLTTDGETAVYLGETVNGNDEYVDWIEVPSIKKGYSYGRKTDGNESWVAFSTSTPFAANGEGSVSPVSPVYTPVEDIQPENLPTIEAYPNPTRDFVYLRTDNMDSDIRYEVYDTNGQLLIKGEGDTVDMQGLAPAMYIIRVGASGYKTGIKVVKR